MSIFHIFGFLILLALAVIVYVSTKSLLSFMEDNDEDDDLPPSIGGNYGF